MRAWKLIRQGMVLQIFDIDDSSRAVRSTMLLPLKENMTDLEAEKYMNDRYPKVPNEVQKSV
jgi:hypothetical protein